MSNSSANSDKSPSSLSAGCVEHELIVLYRSGNIFLPLVKSLYSTVNFWNNVEAIKGKKFNNIQYVKVSQCFMFYYLYAFNSSVSQLVPTCLYVWYACFHMYIMLLYFICSCLSVLFSSVVFRRPVLLSVSLFICLSVCLSAWYCLFLLLGSFIYLLSVCMSAVLRE